LPCETAHTTVNLQYSILSAMISASCNRTIRFHPVAGSGLDFTAAVPASVRGGMTVAGDSGGAGLAGVSSQPGHWSRGGAGRTQAAAGLGHRASGGSILWLLSIGVSRYASELGLSTLTPTLAMGDDRRSSKGYREVRTLVLTNEEVTRESILGGLSRFLGQAGPDDVAVLFVAGHGVRDWPAQLLLPAQPATADAQPTACAVDFDECRIVRRNARAVINARHLPRRSLGPHRARRDGRRWRQMTAGEGFPARRHQARRGVEGTEGSGARRFTHAPSKAGGRATPTPTASCRCPASGYVPAVPKLTAAAAPLQQDGYRLRLLTSAP
jgi:hypothetical protein